VPALRVRGGQAFALTPLGCYISWVSYAGDVRMGVVMDTRVEDDASRLADLWVPAFETILGEVLQTVRAQHAVGPTKGGKRRAASTLLPASSTLTYIRASRLRAHTHRSVLDAEMTVPCLRQARNSSAYMASRAKARRRQNRWNTALIALLAVAAVLLGLAIVRAELAFVLPWA